QTKLPGPWKQSFAVAARLQRAREPVSAVYSMPLFLSPSALANLRGRCDDHRCVSLAQLARNWCQDRVTGVTDGGFHFESRLYFLKTLRSLSCGSATTVWLSMPVMVSAATMALITASSVACTVAKNRGFML